MSIVCYQWGNTNVLWKDAGWVWSMCATTPTPPITSSIEISLQPLGVDATTLIQPWLIEPWNPYRAGEREDNRKRWIKLIIKMNGEEFSEEKEVKDFNMITDDIKLMVQDKKNINLEVKMEK